MIGLAILSVKIIHSWNSSRIQGATIPPPSERRSYRWTTQDAYASSRETTEGRVYSVTGNDWDSLVTEIGATKEERVVVNMGPTAPIYAWSVKTYS